MSTKSRSAVASSDIHDQHSDDQNAEAHNVQTKTDSGSQTNGSQDRREKNVSAVHMNDKGRAGVHSGGSEGKLKTEPVVTTGWGDASRDGDSRGVGEVDKESDIGSAMGADFGDRYSDGEGDYKQENNSDVKEERQVLHLPPSQPIKTRNDRREHLHAYQSQSQLMQALAGEQARIEQTSLKAQPSSQAQEHERGDSAAHSPSQYMSQRLSPILSQAPNRLLAPRPAAVVAHGKGTLLEEASGKQVKPPQTQTYDQRIQEQQERAHQLEQQQRMLDAMHEHKASSTTGRSLSPRVGSVRDIKGADRGQWSQRQDTSPSVRAQQSPSGTQQARAQRRADGGARKGSGPMELREHDTEAASSAPQDRVYRFDQRPDREAGRRLGDSLKDQFGESMKARSVTYSPRLSVRDELLVTHRSKSQQDTLRPYGSGAGSDADMTTVASPAKGSLRRGANERASVIPSMGMGLEVPLKWQRNPSTQSENLGMARSPQYSVRAGMTSTNQGGEANHDAAQPHSQYHREQWVNVPLTRPRSADVLTHGLDMHTGRETKRVRLDEMRPMVNSRSQPRSPQVQVQAQAQAELETQTHLRRQPQGPTREQATHTRDQGMYSRAQLQQRTQSPQMQSRPLRDAEAQGQRQLERGEAYLHKPVPSRSVEDDRHGLDRNDEGTGGIGAMRSMAQQAGQKSPQYQSRSQRTLESIPHQRRDTAERAYGERLQGNVTGGLRERGREGDREFYRGHRGEDDYDRKYYQASGGLSDREHRYERELERASEREWEREWEMGREREWERYRGRDKEESDLREWHTGASAGRDMKRREDRRRNMELDGSREITYRDYLGRTGGNPGQFLPGLSREDGPWFNDRPLVANQRYMVEGTYKRSTTPTDRGYDYLHKRGDMDGSVDPKKAISESPYDYREVYTDSKDGLIDERQRACAMGRGAFDPMGDARQRDMHESRAFRTQAESERDLRMLEDRRREADRDGIDRLPSRTRPSGWTRADPRDRTRFKVEAEAVSARKLRHSPYLENGRTSGGRDVGGDYLDSIADQNTASARDPRSDREAGDWPAGVDRESSLSRARSQPEIAQRSRASNVIAVSSKARKERSPSARARHLSNAQVRGQGHEQPSVSQSHLSMVGTNAHLGVSSTKGSLLLSPGTADSLAAGPYYTRERKYSIVSDSHNNADSKQESGRVRRNSMHTTGSGGSPGGSDVEPVDATPAEKENWRKMKHKKQERKRRDMHNDSFRKLGALLPSKDDINLPKVQVLTEAITHIHELRRIRCALENVRATTAEHTRELQYRLRSLLRDRQRRGFSVPYINPALLDVPPLAFNRPVGSREGMQSRSVTGYEHAERQQTARGSGRDKGYKESLRDRDADADADADAERDQDGGRYMDRDKHTEDTPRDAEKHASADAYDNADGSGEDDDEGDPGVGVHTVKEFVVKLNGGSGSEWSSFSSMHKSATNPKGSLRATTNNSNDNINSNSNNNTTTNKNSSHNTGGHGSGDLDPSSSTRAFDAPYGGTNKHGREVWLSIGGQKRPTGYKRKPSSLSTSDAYSSAFAQPTPGMRSVSGGRPYTAPNRGQQVPTNTQTVGDNSTYSRGLESFSHQARAQRGVSKQMESQRAYSPARDASSRTWSPMRERDSGGRQSGAQLKIAADRGDGSAKMRPLRLHVSVSEAQEMDVDEVVGEGKTRGLHDRYGGTRATDGSRLEGSAMKADEAGAMRRYGSTKHYLDQQENSYAYDGDVEHYGRDKRHTAYEAEQYYVDEFGFEYEPEDLEASDIEYDEIEDALAAQLQTGEGDRVRGRVRGRYRERHGDTDMVQGDKSVGGYTERTGIPSDASRPPTDEHGNASVNSRSELQGNKSAGGHGNNKHSQMPNPRSKGKNSVGRNGVSTISITPNPPSRNRSRASTSSAAKRKTPKSRSNSRRHSESAGGIHLDAYDGYHGNEDGGGSGAEGTYGRGGRPGHNENERRRRSQMNQAFNELQLRLPVFSARSKPSKAHILDEAKKCLVNLKSTRAKLKGQISDLQYSIEDKRRRLEALRSR